MPVFTAEPDSPIMRNPTPLLVASLLAVLTALPAAATTYVLPPRDVNLVGQVQVVKARQEDTLVDIARRHGLGFEEMLHANPGVDPWLPGAGTPVVLPTRYILPDTPRSGVVLNLPEMRLYYYPPPARGERPVVITHPVSIGRMDWRTPLGTTRVVKKQKDPPWYPPASIKAEHAAEGDILPDVVPGGPDNPLGRHALRLGIPGYLIHGTNKPYGIGMRVTHGCVRMYPEDIEALFPLVPEGTLVHIVNQAVKIGQVADTLFLEYHPDLEENQAPLTEVLQQTMERLRAYRGEAQGIEEPVVRAAVEQASGLPVALGP